MDRLRIQGVTFLMLALWLLLLPLQWILAVMLAAAWHELCHMAAVRLCGGRISDFRVDVKGAKIEASGLTEKQVLLCTLAGPFGGLILLLFVRWMPRIALCAAVQSAYNLLPILPLDGGRALECALGLILPYSQAEKACRIISRGMVGLLIGAGIWACFVMKMGVFPLAVGISAIQSVKYSCKQKGNWLQ